ncbi:U32 family peptidase [Photobacterium damselae subsp. piscicida]|nr:U32 family peptidase [Photobacterium damselae]MDP2514526.1 U32 family peptidase [Photobacterium damselae subsp. piscicida]MDP2532201.1 U32 family peptidase [Photobacterium damselae subsp. piscicida]MDP2544150.1 U32 family peptidase [Photobacterium damselae subsp. piscicida]MDP2557717.1 U32 family peptidase [Photobacterium damselae subsp. piscicida]MDP2569056.1 U32 family peptidase [Photobacterium damselae subsp. piscicida]
MALHASTQIDNRDKEKVEFLEQVGFTQVVLARELGGGSN